MWSVLFVFLSYLDRNFVRGEFLSPFLAAEKDSNGLYNMLNGTFCTKRSNIESAEGFRLLHQVSDGVEEVRSVRDQAGVLVDCSIISDQMQVKSFMHLCRLGLSGQRHNRRLGDEAEAEASSVDVAASKSNCLSLLKVKGRRKSQDKSSPALKEKEKGSEGHAKEEKEPGKSLHRTKRGFTYPGTLWCGAGNNADNYDHLGEFAETDKCCRVHDHCQHTIQPFSSKYGLRNYRWYMICHCDCDNALKECLRKVNDTASRVIGQAFFNVIEVPCFEFRYEEQCVERVWYGWCNKYDLVAVAELKSSIPYDFGNVDVIDELTLPPPVQGKPDENAKHGTPDSPTSSTTVNTKNAGPTRPSSGGGSTSTATPEQPSLGNVVTAAEDFIKVLATVSTSHTSSTEAAKKDTAKADKKTKKKKKKVKKNKKKNKGKGLKRKNKLQNRFENQEAVSVAPNAVGEVKINIFLGEDLMKQDKGNFNTDIVNELAGKESDLGGKQDVFNDVLNDEPPKVAETRTPDHKEPVVKVKKNFESEPRPEPASEPIKRKRLGRKGRKRVEPRVLPPPTRLSAFGNRTQVYKSLT
ncbi:protein PROCA1 [Polyodon spathula]|uniref:protein PROCA1 n=1 Tax=Polyodon spathula TaxID=7913 RepID=UPI001B7F5ED6|nr:protein PROCA1 [Polyodon spathula]